MQRPKGMIDNSNKGQARVRVHLQNVLIGLSISAICLIVFLLLLEFLLRAFPALLPAGSYRTEVFDPDLNTTVFSSPVIYNKARYVVRMPNRDGFLDVDHPRTKPSGVKRVATEKLGLQVEQKPDRRNQGYDPHV